MPAPRKPSPARTTGTGSGPDAGAAEDGAGERTPAGDTRERLLDAAEALFVEHGIAGTSVRAITAAAGANLASVNYHFGGRERLVEEVLRRRLGPMNAERLARLDALLTRCGDAPPPLRDVMEAFLIPALEFGSSEGRGFFTLVARAQFSTDENLRHLLLAQFGEVAERFGGVLARVLPGVPREELICRVFFAVGSLCHVVLNAPMLETISGGRLGAIDDGLKQRLLDFATAGVAAAAVPAPATASDAPAPRPDRRP